MDGESLVSCRCYCSEIVKMQRQNYFPSGARLVPNGARPWFDEIGEFYFVSFTSFDGIIYLARALPVERTSRSNENKRNGNARMRPI